MALDSLRFTIQNAGWSTLHPVQAKEARAAMQKYRELHPACEITGSKNKVQVHHIIPVWKDPSLAADPNNFISLSASAHIHIIFGHNNNFGKYYVPNVKYIAAHIREIRSNIEVVERVKVLEYKPTLLARIKSWFT